MNWQVTSLMALLSWGIYSIFGNKATAVHGEKISILFETIAFIVLAAVVNTGSWSNIHKITFPSAVNASIMGILSATGFYLVLKAMSLSPQNMPIIVFVAGLYPLITVVAMHFMGTHLSTYQWTGIGLATIGLILINWPK